MWLILQKETDLARFFKRIKKMGRSRFHSLRSFHYERPIFPLLLKQLLQKQCYATCDRSVINVTPPATEEAVDLPFSVPWYRFLSCDFIATSAPQIQSYITSIEKVLA
jgi:hypothetical protein